MVPTIAVQSILCPDPECAEGVIIVYNAYEPDSFEEQPCDTCNGRGFLVHERVSNN